MAVLHKIDSIIGINKKKEEEKMKFTAMEKKISEHTEELAEYKEKQDIIDKDLDILVGIDNE